MFVGMFCIPHNILGEFHNCHNHKKATKNLLIPPKAINKMPP